MKLLLCVCFAFTIAGAEPPTFYPVPPMASDPGITVEHLKLGSSRQAAIPAVLATVANPAGFVHVFTAGSNNTCSERVKTSETAEKHGCFYAVNGGPFDMNDGSCVGDVVSDGHVVMVDDDNAFASWGLARNNETDGAWQWVFGDVCSDTVADAGVQELVSGFIGPLLVSAGQPVLSGSSLVAPRTAVGINAEGQLLLLTVDGVEDRARGMNISELAIAFVELGAVEAVNLDGGGSTVAWMDGDIVDHPTCSDNATKCERTVATIICVMAE